MVDKKDVPSKSISSRLFNPYAPPITKVQKTWAAKSAGMAAIPK